MAFEAFDLPGGPQFWEDRLGAASGVKENRDVLALDITEVDPVEHTAVGSVTLIADGGQAEALPVLRIEATVTHIFFGADVPYSDSVEPRIDFFPYDRSPALLGYFDIGAMQITDPWAPVTAEAGRVVLSQSAIQ